MSILSGYCIFDKYNCSIVFEICNILYEIYYIMILQVSLLGYLLDYECNLKSFVNVNRTERRSCVRENLRVDEWC